MPKDAPNWHSRILASQVSEDEASNHEPSGNGLPLHARLNSKKEFQRVFDQAIKVADDCYTLLARNSQLTHARLGLAISKKAVRRAVDRNRIKRVVRESFRLHQHTLGALDIVVLARRELDQKSKQQMHASLASLWPRLVKRCATS